MNGCPACRAAFRGVAVCSRCGADLGPLMSVAARAHHLRESARRRILAGDFRGARELAARAQFLHATGKGRALLAVAGALDRA